MTAVIRPASLRDVDELAELVAAAYRATYADLVPPATLDTVVPQVSAPEGLRRMLQDVERGAGLSRALVAVEGETLVGFLDFAEEHDGLELRRLYTRVGMTSKGVGAALLRALEDTLPAGTRYRIVVVEGNTRGLRFWKRHGFEEVGEVDGIEHFSRHRGVEFDPETTGPRLTVLMRTAGG
ncbi:MAG TPA: GNAT family N-acetyltransferase [Mycobacteriales bacterium]|nr:GNAT family N-acetyltransferase [Mycobacteriales bacterium]